MRNQKIVALVLFLLVSLSCLAQQVGTTIVGKVSERNFVPVKVASDGKLLVVAEGIDIEEITISTGSFNINNINSGTVAISTGCVSIRSGNVTVTTGTVAISTGTVAISNNLTLASGTVAVSTGTIAISSGNVTVTTGTVVVFNDLTLASGTVKVATGTVDVNNLPLDSGKVITTGSVTIIGPVDSKTLALETISYEHHEIHAGSFFSIQDYLTLSNSASITFTIITPNTTKWAHMLFTVEGSLLTTFEVYENASSTGGGVIYPINSDRNNSASSTLTIASASGIISLGTRILGFSAGSGTNASSARPGSGSRDYEMILKQNTTYFFRIISGAASNIVSYQFRWYEHTNK